MDQIIELIQWSAQPDNQIQKQVYKRAQELSQDTQFLIHLCSVIIGNYDAEIRYRAAVILKSAVKNCTTLPETLQQMLIQVDLSIQIMRQAFVIIVPEVVVRNGIKNSNIMMEYLIKLIDSDPVIATDCLSKIIEDLKFNSENINYYGTDTGLQLIDQLIFKFISLVEHSNTQVVVNSLNFLNYNIFFMPPSLNQYIDCYINILITGTRSQEQQIRLKCFQGIQALIETNRDKIKQMNLVIMACVQSLSDPDKEVVRFVELCLTDFLRFNDAEDYEKTHLLEPYLQQILQPIILNLAITRSDQIAIQPTFSNSYNQGGKNEDEEQDEEKTLGEYSLRSVSNLLLKKLIEFYDKTIVPIVLQIIDQLQQQQDWKQQEIAVICLGLFAEKIMENHANLVPNILMSLFQEKNQQNEYIYASTLWTFSQYNEWIKTVAINETQFIQSYLKLLLISIENQSIIVKESACSALNSLSKDAFFILQPYLLDLFQVYLKALSQKGGVLLYIYQSITTILAECETIENQELIDLIMTKLISNLIDLNDYNICPLYECLAEAVEKFGQRALKYIPVIYQAIVQSMNGYVQSIQNGKTRLLYQQKEILKRSFDVCIKIINITKESFLELCDQSFLQIVDLAIQDTETDVKQYALSLIGELIKDCYTIFKNVNIAIVLNEYIYAQSISIDPSKLFLATSNNAAWALGELAMKDPAKLTVIFNAVMEKLIKIINEPKFPKSIAQNLCIAICRIAGSHIQQIEEFIPSFFKRVCLILSQIKSQSLDEYKEESFKILINIVKMYPGRVINDIKYFVYCIVASNEFPSIKPLFVNILQELQQSFGQQKFDSMFSSDDLPNGFRMKMINIYGV
ncbi:unnamed protein product (macronuclear) [Paramecium tetraurelia]|uniref:Importin N-terminal domain-containing protein n=1 Tax=Paramecium tetraurelia TaxID=5888 RepID=A0E5R6_PARTE|nr:uncharacterized protein GSPATT00003495001 [Paramecium tetraurelia]CAK90633.1 unnamed protein product [Paramecium tetraurelia]|eukprot:XP_001458030.1 hypothetical protein (macronuclear) [Paramecium tetraurelia strain d4-2]